MSRFHEPPTDSGPGCRGAVKIGSTPATSAIALTLAGSLPAPATITASPGFSSMTGIGGNRSSICWGSPPPPSSDRPPCQLPGPPPCAPLPRRQGLPVLHPPAAASCRFRLRPARCACRAGRSRSASGSRGCTRSALTLRPILCPRGDGLRHHRRHPTDHGVGIQLDQHRLLGIEVFDADLGAGRIDRNHRTSQIPERSRDHRLGFHLRSVFVPFPEYAKLVAALDFLEAARDAHRRTSPSPVHTA